MCGPEPRIGTPAARARGRCSCGAPALIVFEGEWCALCALFAIEAAPARRWLQLEAEVAVARGARIYEVRA
jgi:hypothetical protein